MAETLGVVRQDTPPAGGPRINILSPDGKGSFCCVVCSIGIEGYVTHWIGRTVPHIEREGVECPFCKRQAPKAWKGYILCTDVNGRTKFFLELTADAARLLQQQYEGVETMRGSIIHVKRQHARKKSTLICEVTSWIDPTMIIPKDQPALPQLERLWGTALLS